MAYDEKLATRARAAIGARKDLAEIKMFGGLCFTVAGNMACGVLGDDLIVRVPQDRYEAVLEEKGARPFDMMGGGRVPKGFVIVDAQSVKSAPSLRRWVQRGVEHAASLPPKPAKKKR